MTCRKRRDDVKTGVESLSRDQRGGDPLTARVASGIKVARVRSRLEQGTWEPVASMPREEPKWKPHEGPSTEARHRGGWACSRVEVPVMGMERRGPITQFSSSDQLSNGEESGGETQSVAAYRREVNPAMGRSLGARPGRRPGDKSRMSREAPVRFREGLGVKFPRATRLVVLARYQTRRLKDWIEETLEGRFRLTINREKTRTVKLAERGESLSFLGFTLRYDRDRFGRSKRYLNVFPSKKAMERARAKLRELTSHRRSFVPIDEMVGEVSGWLVSWGSYFRHGYPSEAFRELNWYAMGRLRRQLRRRSQRAYRIPEGESVYEHLRRLGFQPLSPKPSGS